MSEGDEPPYDYVADDALPDLEEPPLETRADRAWEVATDALALVIRYTFLIAMCVVVIGVTLLAFMVFVSALTSAISNNR